MPTHRGRRILPSPAPPAIRTARRPQVCTSDQPSAQASPAPDRQVGDCRRSRRPADDESRAEAVSALESSPRPQADAADAEAAHDAAPPSALGTTSTPQQEPTTVKQEDDSERKSMVDRAVCDESHGRRPSIASDADLDGLDSRVQAALRDVLRNVIPEIKFTSDIHLKSLSVIQLRLIFC